MAGDANSHYLPLALSAIANLVLFGCYGTMIAFLLLYITGRYLVPLVANHIMLMMIIGVVFLVAMPGFSNGHNTFTRFKEPYQTMIFMLFWHPLMAVLVISDTTYIQALGRTEELSKGTVIMIYCAVGAAGVATLANIYGLFTGKKPGGAKKDDDKADVSN